MKYSSTKASNAPIESNHIKKGNKTNKTPIKVQPIELNTIFGLFVNRKKNSTKKKETNNAAPLYFINKHELNDTPRTINVFLISFIVT